MDTGASQASNPQRSKACQSTAQELLQLSSEAGNVIAYPYNVLGLVLESMEAVELDQGL